MKQTDTFIDYLKSEHPRWWNAINKAADEGLIVIDEANDALTDTNRLLMTYPALHAVLKFLLKSWVRGKRGALPRHLHLLS